MVDVEVVIFKKVVTNINVGITVVIDVAYGKPKSIPDGSLEDTGFLGYIDKSSILIFKKDIARHGIDDFSFGPFSVGTIGVYGVVKEVHVQITVQVVIEKGSLGRIAYKVQTIFLGFFLKYWDAFCVVPLIDVE